LAAALTSAVADILDVQPQSVQVLIDELERENWAIGGELQSDQQSRADDLDLDALFKKPTSAPPRTAAKAQPRKPPAKSRSRR
jgi:hypothetical protein